MTAFPACDVAIERTAAGEIPTGRRLDVATETNRRRVGFGKNYQTRRRSIPTRRYPAGIVFQQIAQMILPGSVNWMSPLRAGFSS